MPPRGAAGPRPARRQAALRPSHRGGAALWRRATRPARLLPATPPPDPAGVAHWIALGNRPDAGTLYAGVERLGPGEAVRFGRAGVERRRYWAPRFQAPLELAPEELAGRVRESLRTAVERRLSPQGGTGVTMSGGLDSASIAALTGGRAIACSATFPEHGAADESELIAVLREALGLQGLVAEVRSGGLLARALEHLSRWQLPQRGWGDFWQLPLMRSAAEHGVVTMLGGDGGDELFGPRFYALADAVRAGRPARTLTLARQLPGAGPHVGRRAEAAMIGRVGLGGALPPPPAGRVLPFTRERPPDWLRRESSRALAASEDPDAWKRLDGPRWWANAAHGIAYGIEAAGVCEHIRRCAAEAGLAARHPMLDLDLVELALRQPPSATLDPRFTRPVLREAVAGLVPDPVRLRPAKARFESLIISCLSGPDGAAVRELLTAPGAALGEFVDGEAMGAALFGSDSARRKILSVDVAGLEAAEPGALAALSKQLDPRPGAKKRPRADSRRRPMRLATRTFFPLDREPRASTLRVLPNLLASRQRFSAEIWFPKIRSDQKMDQVKTQKGYEAPRVVDYGDLQELTAACLGGSGGDAGFPGTVGPYGAGPSNPAAGCKSNP